MRRLARCYHIWLKVAAALALLTWWVQGWFVPSWLAPRYRDAFPLLRDRTFGRNLDLLLELLPRRRPGDGVRVVLVGDSTVGGALSDEATLAWKLRRELRAALPDRHVDVADLGVIGLRTPDALVFVAKAFSTRPDLVVYATSPRTVPARVELSPSVRDVSLEWDVVSRIGLPLAVDLVRPASLPRAFVFSAWPPARFRVELREAALGLFGMRWNADAPPLGQPAPSAAAAEGERMLKAAAAGTYLWTRADYALTPPTRSSRALDALIRLCGREGRALLYHVPVNPAAVRGFEPGVVDAFAAYVDDRAAVAGVPFFDYRAAQPPSAFRVNSHGDPDAIHMSGAGLDGFARVLAGAVVERLRSLGL